MMLKRFNNWLIILIILCSTSFYKFSVLGDLQKGFELLGIVLIVVSIILNLVYSERKGIRHRFNLPLALIFLSLVASMPMATLFRDQTIAQTLYAQYPIYYYLFYFLLHQMAPKPRDIEKIFIMFGILYILFFFIQYLLYPTLLFDAYVTSDRGTIRIYLPGTDYLFITFFFCVQYFFRTNKLKYLILLLVIAAVFILTGGRQTMATVVLIVVMFLLFDRRIKSRLAISFVGIVSAIAIYFMFQGVFEAIFNVSQSDLRLGENYSRFRAAEYYLTDFFKSPIAYITGNGMCNWDSGYGKEVTFNMVYHRYFLSDIGIIGNYAVFGLFFVLGIFIILIRSLSIKIEAEYIYIKLMFISMLLSVIIAAGFALSDTICFVTMALYVIDVSNSARVAS